MYAGDFAFDHDQLERAITWLSPSATAGFSR
jgi:hypothetical protein